MKKPKKIAIIGAGITGLVSAYLLSRRGHQVTVFEKNMDIGGLGSSIKINGTFVEKYYHHFFSSDTELIKLISDLKLKNEMKCYPSSVGFYIKQKLFPFTTPLDLLKFPPLSFLDRIKMGLLTLYFTQKSNWKNLEKYTCAEFFNLIKAPQLYETIWKPLLRLKFGSHEPNIPATFIWGRIRPRARSRKGLHEKLAYLNGGFNTLFEKLLTTCRKNKVKIKFEKVKKFEDVENKIKLTTSKNKYHFHKLIFTGNNLDFVNLNKSLTPKQTKNLKKIKYQAINCLLLNLKKSVSPYYWLNVVDPSISFIGLVEHTKLIPKNHYPGHLLYIFNYLPVTDKIYKLKPQKVFDLYTKDLKKIFPQFQKDWVQNWWLSRDQHATPIYSGQYSKLKPPHKISQNIYLTNTSHIYPKDRNINNGIKLSKQISKLIHVDNSQN